MKISEMMKDDPPEQQPSRLEISAALRGAETVGYLVVTGASVIEFTYRQRMKEQGRASIIIRRQDRHAELITTLQAAKPLLVDNARNLIADHLLSASLPGGSVIVSNRRIIATRLGFHFAFEFATWLRSFVEDSRNLAKGHAREHARVEAVKRTDGSIHYRQKGITRIDLKRLAAGA